MYLFYCNQNIQNNDLEKRLQSLQASKNKNLLVIMSNARSALYSEIVNSFGIVTPPAIILTASLCYENYCETACVIIQDKKTLESVDLTIQITEVLVDLLKERTRKFLQEVRYDYHDKKESRLRELMLNALKKKVKLLPEDSTRIVISFIQGTFKIVS
jgi:hypothetical protein